MKLEIDEKGVYYVFPERTNTPEEQQLDNLLAGSKWERPQPGTRMKLHPELMSKQQFKKILQHVKDPAIIDFFRSYKNKYEVTVPCLTFGKKDGRMFYIEDSITPITDEERIRMIEEAGWEFIS